MNTYETRAERTKNFLADRFGMFIHWGLYAIPARGEWVKSTEKITDEEYQKYFDEFNPIHYDPKKWAKVAKQAGMKYAVLTAKHHDGFCLFDSKLTDYKSTNTKCGRDLVGEYIEAFRAEGIKIGLYYSLLDWHHPDYPHYGDGIHPMSTNEAFKDVKHDFPKYVEYLHGQVKELLTNYGKIDIMWFDFSYGEMYGEKWEATKLVRMMRSIQPDIVIDNRLGGSGIEMKTGELDEIAGDFDSPEQIIPSEGIVDSQGRPVPWEACLTLNNNWGYASQDKNYKSPKTVVRTLVECVAKGGNMLINVGPNAKGEIPKESVAILAEVGEWMHENSDSIYGAGKCDLQKPEWGYYTQNDKMVYAHLFDRGIGTFRLNGLQGKIKQARLLADGAELKLDRPWNAAKFPDDAFINLSSAVLPDDVDTVLALELL